MTKQLDNTTALWAIDVLCRYAPESVGGVAEPQRRYASDPAADYHVECFKRQCERDRKLRELMGDREEDARREPSDAEEFFLEQQCPSDRAFR